MRIIFMGTPDFAVPTLNALVEAGHEVAAVYTQPPRRANRGKKLTPSAVHARADELGLTVRTPVSLKSAEEQEAFAALEADIAVVAAYGLILPQEILDAPKYGCLNVHGSLLPRWRGAAPVQRAIMEGDHETGVCIMQMETGLDTGPVRASGRILTETKTAGELTEELAAMGAELMVEVIGNLNGYPPVPQSDEGLTYANKIDKAEARIDFCHTSDQLVWEILGLSPFPGAWFEYRGERIKVLRAETVEATPTIHGEVMDDNLQVACAFGCVRLTELQRPGKGPMKAEDFLRGFPVPTGTRLS